MSETFYRAHVPQKRQWQPCASVMCTAWGGRLAGNLMVSLQGWQLRSKSLWQAGVKAAVCRRARRGEKKCYSVVVVVELVGGWQEAPRSTAVDAQIQSWEYEVCVREGRSGRVFVESSTRKRRRRRGLVFTAARPRNAVRLLAFYDWNSAHWSCQAARTFVSQSQCWGTNQHPLSYDESNRSKLQHKTRKKQRKPLSVETREITADAVVAAVLLDLHSCCFFYIKRGTKNGSEGFQCHSSV